ncbi:MAG: hypothetical protein DCC67_17885 [Planctomycetota bacterium]|nr:MAG: hypothetical protein DCC67_17885 [Planctomycetota bacterium]
MIIVIPTCGRSELLRTTLQTLGECRQPSSPVRTVVAENGPRAGAEEAVRGAAAWLHAEYQHSETPNKSASLNLAIAGAGEELMVFFDDDVRIASSTLVAYQQAAERHPAGVFFGGSMGVDYEEAPPEWVKQTLPPSALGVMLDSAAEARKAPFLGCNWAAYASDLRRCGGFNVNVGPGAISGATGQETEMQVRLSLAGLRPKVVPDAMVWHYVPKARCSPQWSLARSYKNGMSTGLTRKHDGMQFFGCPTWLVRKYVGQIIALYLNPMTYSRHRRFKAKCDLQYMRGQMAGLRHVWMHSRRGAGLGERAVVNLPGTDVAG